MSTDIALVATADEIATLPAADRAVMVTHALHESKQWLAVATKGTDPTPIADFKAWAATVAEMTRQKGLASDIQADALEMVRRAERGLDVAVRNGQASGDISTDAGARWSVGNPDRISKPSPRDFFVGGAERSDAHQMGDLTEQEFEEVIAEAREEGNLSRANVVRKIKGANGPESRVDRAELITKLAARGMASAQMASKVGVTEETVRQIARDFAIDIPADRLTRGTRRIDSIRIARSTVTSLDGIASTVDLVNDLTGLDPEEAQQWTASLDQTIQALRRLNTKIKEAVL